MAMSRGFVCALGGVAMTLIAWYGPWAWPGWPAFALIELAFGSHAAFSELSYATRAAAVLVLIVVNVAFWAALFWAVALAASMRRT
jgi:hypothetical protein